MGRTRLVVLDLRAVIRTHVRDHEALHRQLYLSIIRRATRAPV